MPCRAKQKLVTQRVQVSLLWYILIGYFGGLSIYHSDTWTLWVIAAFRDLGLMDSLLYNRKPKLSNTNQHVLGGGGV